MVVEKKGGIKMDQVRESTLEVKEKDGVMDRIERLSFQLGLERGMGGKIQRDLDHEFIRKVKLWVRYNVGLAGDVLYNQKLEDHISYEDIRRFVETLS